MTAADGGVLEIAFCCPGCQEQSYHAGGDETCRLLTLQVHSVPPLRSCQALPEHFMELCGNQTLVMSFFPACFQ